MTLESLAIQVEAWLQEELAGQRAVLDALARLESAARAGEGVALERSGGELESLLGHAGARELRRRALLERLAGALALPVQAVSLTRLGVELASAGVETRRLERLRAELRETVTSVVQAARRLAAMAHVHRGVLEELCGLFLADAPGGAHLVDARG